MMWGEDYCRRLTVQNSVLLDRTDSTKVQIHQYIPSGLLRSIHASQLTSSFERTIAEMSAAARGRGSDREACLTKGLWATRAW